MISPVFWPTIFIAVDAPCALQHLKVKPRSPKVIQVTKMRFGTGCAVTGNERGDRYPFTLYNLSNNVIFE